VILAAQENQPSNIIQALDKVARTGAVRCSAAQVVEILKATGSPDLFSPELDSDRKKPRDPVTTDLLGALLAVSTCSALQPTQPLPLVSPGCTANFGGNCSSQRFNGPGPVNGGARLLVGPN
jgi:hypothetical protein